MPLRQSVFLFFPAAAILQPTLVSSSLPGTHSSGLQPKLCSGSSSWVRPLVVEHTLHTFWLLHSMLFTGVLWASMPKQQGLRWQVFPAGSLCLLPYLCMLSHHWQDLSDPAASSSYQDRSCSKMAPFFLQHAGPFCLKRMPWDPVSLASDLAHTHGLGTQVYLQWICRNICMNHFATISALDPAAPRLYMLLSDSFSDSFPPEHQPTATVQVYLKKY
ncbi:hypothetical protein OG21DRAFT_1528014 [Imleria badia]|nr:hypothetical protein OG21DRAFT_1528014 [Imleria badia]